MKVTLTFVTTFLLITHIAFANEEKEVGKYLFKYSKRHSWHISTLDSEVILPLMLLYFDPYRYMKDCELYLFVANDRKTVFLNKNIFTSKEAKIIALKSNEKEILEFYDSVNKLLHKHLGGKPPVQLKIPTYHIKLYDKKHKAEDSEAKLVNLRPIRDYFFKPFRETKWFIEKPELKPDTQDSYIEEVNKMWQDEEFLKFKDENWNMVMKLTRDFIKKLEKRKEK